MIIKIFIPSQRYIEQSWKESIRLEPWEALKSTQAIKDTKKRDNLES